MVRRLSRLPILLLPIVELALNTIVSCEPPTRDLDIVEMFAGWPEGTIAREGRLAGKNVAAYGKKIQGSHNILKSKGVLQAAKLIMRLKRGAHLWMAPCCSHWVFMCSCQHGRTTFNTHGQESWPPVVAGNTQAMVLCLLVVLGFLRETHLYIEQPRSSLLHRHLQSTWFL